MYFPVLTSIRSRRPANHWRRQVPTSCWLHGFLKNVIMIIHQIHFLFDWQRNMCTLPHDTYLSDFTSQGYRRCRLRVSIWCLATFDLLIGNHTRFTFLLSKISCCADGCLIWLHGPVDIPMVHKSGGNFIQQMTFPSRSRIIPGFGIINQFVQKVHLMPSYAEIHIFLWSAARKVIDSLSRHWPTF